MPSGPGRLKVCATLVAGKLFLSGAQVQPAMTPLSLVGDEETGKSFRFRQLLYPALEFRALHALMVGQTCPNVKWPPGAEGVCRAEALLWMPIQPGLRYWPALRDRRALDVPNRASFPDRDFWTESPGAPANRGSAK